MSEIRDIKIQLARDIIEEAKIRGINIQLPTGKEITPELLASAHSLPELKQSYRTIVRR